jgi:hypothetical protein
VQLAQAPEIIPSEVPENLIMHVSLFQLYKYALMKERMSILIIPIFCNCPYIVTLSMAVHIE